MQSQLQGSPTASTKRDMLKQILTILRPSRTTLRAYAYHDAPERLDVDAQGLYGRLWIARTPSGAVKAAGWDCGETRKAARRWATYGLRLELAPRSSVAAIQSGDVRGIFKTTRPVGAALSPAELEAALGPHR